MMKRKPDKVVVHRIEMQQKERDLIEQAILFQNVSSIFNSLSRMEIKTIYYYLTLFEALGLIDTPVPTIGDGSIANALNAWAKNYRDKRDRDNEAIASQINVDPSQPTLGFFDSIINALQVTLGATLSTVGYETDNVDAI